MEKQLGLYYEGTRSVSGIDANEAARILSSFHQFMSIVARSVDGREAHPSLRVQAYREGSDLFDLILHTAAVVAPLAGQAYDILMLVRECISLLNHLDGRQPKKVVSLGDGSVAVENNNGVVNNFNNSVVHIVLNTGISDAAEDFIKKPLENNRSSLRISSKEGTVVEVSSEYGSRVKRIPRKNELLTNTFETYLTIRAVVLEGSGIWKFNDGGRVLQATMEDRNFLARVHQGEERFGHGDILRVRMRAVQTREAGKLKTGYFIEEVLGHNAHDEADQQILDI